MFNERITMQRTLKIPLYVTGDTDQERYDQKAMLCKMFDEYRAAMRKAFADYAFLHIQSAEIQKDKNGNVSLKPDIQKVRDVEKVLFGGSKTTGQYHNLKRYMDLFNSRIRSDASRAIQSYWKAKDQEITKCNRGYLVLQGKRMPGKMFNACMYLHKEILKIDKHEITFRPFADTKEKVKLKIKSLDPHAWGIWKRMVSGDLNYGCPAQLQLTKKRDLILFVAYEQESKKQQDAVKGRVMDLGFDTENAVSYVQMHMREGHKSRIDDMRNDSLDVTGAIDIIDRLRKQREHWERMKKTACGKRDGNRKADSSAVEHLNKITLNRTRVVRGWNHTWTRRIVTRAHAWRCEKIIMQEMPDDLCERSWLWSDFRDKLAYKAQEYGIDLEILGEKSRKKKQNEKKNGSKQYSKSQV